jgi:hypothetical protein
MVGSRWAEIAVAFAAHYRAVRSDSVTLNAPSVGFIPATRTSAQSASRPRGMEHGTRSEATGWCL